jgi:hypothetical protein
LASEWENEPYWASRAVKLYEFLKRFEKAAKTSEVFHYMLTEVGCTHGETMSLMAGLFRKRLAFSPRPGLFMAIIED